MEINYYSRVTGKMEKEKVYGGKAVEWLYESRIGNLIANLLAYPTLSQLCGIFQDSVYSRKNILPFIKEYGIDLEEYVVDIESEDPKEAPYKTFNDFFIRNFRPGKRIFCKEKKDFPAFCEARYLGYESSKSNQLFSIKGNEFSTRQILNSDIWSNIFLEGPLLIARLCPVDYHKFHFPDDGRLLDFYQIPGQYHSVNPAALNANKDIFFKNERHVSIFETENFGRMAYIEVGAMCVGKIVQTLKRKNFSKGEEKGYFKFGGSTVIVIGEKGSWIPDKDILSYTKKNIETFAPLGGRIGTRL